MSFGNKECDHCGQKDEIWAKLEHTTAEDGKATFYLCGECSDSLIGENMTGKAKKREAWGN